MGLAENENKNTLGEADLASDHSTDAMGSTMTDMARADPSCMAIAAIDEAAGTIEFTRGKSLAPEAKLRIGSVTVLDQFDASKKVFLNKLRFEDNLAISIEEAGQVRPVLREQLLGDFFEALTLPDAKTFYSRVQLHHSRFESRIALYFGARATFLNHGIHDPVLGASALTVLAHRILEISPKLLRDEDYRDADWIVRNGQGSVEALQQMIETSPKVDWTWVRWLVSLSTVMGYLALLLNELHLSKKCFENVAAQTERVGLSKVSALNLVTGCFLAGMLAAMAGDTAKAKQYLYEGLLFFPKAATVQDYTANVWVIGDMLNVGAISRQCFIALYKLKLLDRPDDSRVVIDKVTTISLTHVKSPLLEILRAGKCPELMDFFQKVAGAPQ